jgi:hypothetical protein
MPTLLSRSAHQKSHRSFNPLHRPLSQRVFMAALLSVLIVVPCLGPARGPQRPALAASTDSELQPRAFLPAVVGPLRPLRPQAYLPAVMDTTVHLMQPPAHLHGGPLAWASIEAYMNWYLPPDGRIVALEGAVEPYPLDPALGIRDIANFVEQTPPGLIAATAQGIYRREPSTMRWQKMSDLVASHVSVCMNHLWVTPDDHPQEIWESNDDGQTWASVSQGLQGIVVTQIQVELASCSGLNVLTILNGQYVLWRRGRTDGTLPWAQYLTIPGAAVAFSPGGVPGSMLADWIHGPFYAGSTDGHIYQAVYHYDDPPYQFDHWELQYDFGPGKYPILLDREHVSVLDLQSGELQLYKHFNPAYPSVPVPPEWRPAVFPKGDAAWGAKVLPGGVPIKRIFTPNQNADPTTYLALGWDGGLYAYEYDPDNPNGEFIYQFITSTVPHTRMVMGFEAEVFAEVKTVFAGATLTWNGADCTGDDSGFYRSADKGATWTTVATDTARQPIAALQATASITYRVLAATCAGPSLSSDGGAHWLESATLGWPLPAGAQFVAVRRVNGVLWMLYAAGVQANGTAFVYRTSLNADTGLPDTWSNITPSGLVTPTALQLGVYGQNEDDVYVADANTVWLSPDDGLTWQSRSQGLNGAKVRALFDYYNAITGPAIMAATDQGLVYGLSADVMGVWVHTAYTYTTQPREMQFSTIIGGSPTLIGEDYVFDLYSDLFIYPCVQTVAVTHRLNWLNLLPNRKLPALPIDKRRPGC